MLQLSDTPIGQLSVERDWVDGQWVDTDRHAWFVSSLGDRKFDRNTRTATQSLWHRADNLAGADCYHRNYLDYLRICWRDHLGVVVSPDIVWYSLLCELAAMVKEDTETYRYLFTDSPEKKTVVVWPTAAVALPLYEVLAELRHLVPTDVDDFLPQFSTSSERSRHAFHAAFADLVSPYYNYMLLSCDIPCIDVRGTAEDWQRLREHWGRLRKLLSSTESSADLAVEERIWYGSVSYLLDEIVEHRDSAEFWRGMFRMDRCGSGGQVEVAGWIVRLFRTIPRTRFPENFAGHLSQVNYLNGDTGRGYAMKVGLFLSRLEGDLLVPDFGHLVFEDTAPQMVK